MPLLLIEEHGKVRPQSLVPDLSQFAVVGAAVPLLSVLDVGAATAFHDLVMASNDPHLRYSRGICKLGKPRFTKTAPANPVAHAWISLWFLKRPGINTPMAADAAIVNAIKAYDFETILKPRLPSVPDDLLEKWLSYRNVDSVGAKVRAALAEYGVNYRDRSLWENRYVGTYERKYPTSLFGHLFTANLSKPVADGSLQRKKKIRMKSMLGDGIFPAPTADLGADYGA